MLLPGIQMSKRRSWAACLGSRTTMGTVLPRPPYSLFPAEPDCASLLSLCSSLVSRSFLCLITWIQLNFCIFQGGGYGVAILVSPAFHVLDTRVFHYSDPVRLLCIHSVHSFSFLFNAGRYCAWQVHGSQPRDFCQGLRFMWHCAHFGLNSSLLYQELLLFLFSS